MNQEHSQGLTVETCVCMFQLLTLQLILVQYLAIYFEVFYVYLFLRREIVGVHRVERVLIYIVINAPFNKVIREVETAEWKK